MGNSFFFATNAFQMEWGFGNNHQAMNDIRGLRLGLRALHLRRFRNFSVSYNSFKILNNFSNSICLDHIFNLLLWKCTFYYVNESVCLKNAKSKRLTYKLYRFLVLFKSHILTEFPISSVLSSNDSKTVWNSFFLCSFCIRKSLNSS